MEPVFAPQYRGQLDFTDKPAKDRKEDFYYARVIQANGDVAISSPIWVGNPTP